MKTAIGDMWQPETYRAAPAEADVVIHAAQDKPKGRWTKAAALRMHESDALMTGVLADGCLKYGSPFRVYERRLNYMGHGDAWFDETAAVRPCLLAQGHANCVAELERRHRDAGLDVVIISPGLVYGAGGMLLAVVELLRNGRYRVMGDGKNYWSLVHVADLAELYVLASERSSSGENYFAGDDCPLQRRAMIDMVSSALGLLEPAGSPVGWLACCMALPWSKRCKFPCESVTTKPDRNWAGLQYPTFEVGLPSVLRELGISAK